MILKIFICLKFYDISYTIDLKYYSYTVKKKSRNSYLAIPILILL